MSVINRPIKNSKMSGENMNTLRTNLIHGMVKTVIANVLWHPTDQE